jgi:hypothetical protein
MKLNRKKPAVGSLYLDFLDFVYPCRSILSKAQI